MEVIIILINFDILGFGNGAVFSDAVYHSTYYRTELIQGIIDDIYIEENTNLTDVSLVKPTTWSSATVLSCDFKDSMEAGSLVAGEVQIDKVRFQKRLSDELEWSTVAEVDYIQGDHILYEAIDKFISNDFVYQYCMRPITSTTPGDRVVSEEITASFEGIFLSDSNSNYRLFYDLEPSEITHNGSPSIMEPLNSQYPIVMYSTQDYRTLSVKSTIISDATTEAGGQVNIKQEKLTRQQLLSFLKNKRPKIYRSSNADTILVNVTDNPKEEPLQGVTGIAKVSFSLTEIGNTSTENLSRLGLILNLTEVF